MYEENHTAIGSIKCTYETRVSLATKSIPYNLKNALYQDLFRDLNIDTEMARYNQGSTSSTSSTGERKDHASVVEEDKCRFCFSSEGDLISPCMCRGSNEWVHLTCLREWQKNVLLTQSTHPKYQTSIDRICNVCLEPFSGKGIPQSRREGILKYLGGSSTTGTSVASLVSPGNLLVSTRDSSRENLELMEQHPEIRTQLLTWTKAVFLMLRCSGYDSDGGGLLAVSMSRPIDQPLRNQKEWAHKMHALPAHIVVKHFDGGPMEREEPMAICSSTLTSETMSSRKEIELRKLGVHFVPPFFLYGVFDNVIHVLSLTEEEDSNSSSNNKRKKNKRMKTSNNNNTTTTDSTEAATEIKEQPLYRMLNGVTKVHVIWGCGGWGGTQVLAEIARGGWGLVTLEEWLKERPDSELPVDFELDFGWERAINQARLAPKSEYSTR